MNNLDFKSFWNKGIGFEEYYKSVIHEIENGNPNSDYYPYYELNLKRMERLNSKIKLTDNQNIRINELNDKFNLLIITEGWCGDAAQIIPVIQKMDEASENISTKMIFRDQNPELMDAFLTNGARSIPIIIGLDESLDNQIFSWGPRPQQGMDLLKNFKEEKFTKEEFQLNLQKFYNKDKGNSIIEEILEKL